MKVHAFDAEAFLRRLWAMDAVLVAAGFPATSPWWRAQVERFFRALAAGQTGRCRQWIVRVGRRGGKSSTLCRLAVAWALYGTWSVPPGDVGVVAFVSVSKDEAGQRLRTIRAILDALGVPYDQRGEELQLRDRPAVFKVFACTVAAVSGFTAIMVIGDEVAKWRDAESGANPATEVLASLRPTTATQAFAPFVLSSTPLGTLDAHATAFDAGDTDYQLTSYAESWTANPTLTREACERLEPDPRVFAREYQALPQASLSSAFDPVAVLRALRHPPVGQLFQQIGIVDASSGGGDAFSWGRAGYVVPMSDAPRWLMEKVPRRNLVRTSKNGIIEEQWVDDLNDLIERPVFDANGRQVESPEWYRASRPVLVFHKIDAFEGRFAGTIAGSEIVRRIAADFRRAGVRVVLGDQREAFFLHGEFQRNGLRFIPLTWTNALKIEGVTRLKRMFAENAIVLPQREKLKKELLNYAERVTASGAITYSARGSGHDDEAALLITCALGELEKLLPGSPAYAPNVRHVVHGL